MFFIPSMKPKLLLAIMAMMSGAGAIAQDAAEPPVKTVISSTNQLVNLLLIAAIVLAFVIIGLSRILLLLGKKVLEKNKSTNLLLLLLLLGLSMAPAQNIFAQGEPVKEVIKLVPNYGGLSQEAFYMLASVIGVEVLVILFLAFSIRRIYAEFLPEKAPRPAKAPSFNRLWEKLDKKIFTRAVAVEKEADIMLDHDYDGIRELDNALPPWWKYGFYITIGIAIVYLLNFHVFASGKNPTEEYAAEMNKAKIEKEIFEEKNKDKIDENNVPMADAAGLLKAREIFTSKCWSCHGKEGEGGAGPNLTDNYWLHKGSLNDIYHTIKTGYPDKGMQSWANDYTPKEISYLASYIKKLHGTNPPNAKAPQGELYEDTPANSRDSLGGLKSDSTVPEIKKTGN